MREAVGGTLLFYIVITFLLLYIIFMAFVMNYASAYRASNYIVSQIEACNADLNNCGSVNYDTVKDTISSKYGYSDDIAYCCYNNANGSVYRVTLGVNFELPFVGRFPTFRVNTESKTIYNVSCADRPSVTVCRK